MMDHVLAKVKGLRKNVYRKLISDYALFDKLAIDPAGCVLFNSDHNLDEDSWFKVEKFSSKAFCIDIVKGNFDSKNYDDLTGKQFEKLAYLLSIQDGDFYFQKITPSLFIRKKTLIFGEVAQIENTESRLIVNFRPDAIYLTASDTLVFRNLATISSIFPGIDELFKEATREEVEQFLDESFIKLSNDFDISKVSKPNRKRVALAMVALKAMSDADKVNMLTYIDDYCKQKLKLDQTSKEFEISTDEELKYLLYGVEQRFYTTPFGHEKRLANSVQSLT